MYLLLVLHHFISSPSFILLMVLNQVKAHLICIYQDTQQECFNPSFCRRQLQRQSPALCALRRLKTSPASHSDAIATPPLDGAPKQYSPKIQQLVDDIASLTLLEVSDLNELLKVRVKVLECFGSKTQYNCLILSVVIHLWCFVFVGYRKHWIFRTLGWCRWHQLFLWLRWLLFNWESKIHWLLNIITFETLSRRNLHIILLKVSLRSCCFTQHFFPSSQPVAT